MNKVEPCNLTVYTDGEKSKQERVDEALEGYPQELIDLANGITNKWSHAEKVSFGQLPSHMQEKEMIRLVHKYSALGEGNKKRKQAVMQSNRVKRQKR